MKTWDAIYQEWQTDDGQIHAQRMGFLIRCKECIKKELCSIYRDARQEYGFCAWSERKEE